MADYRPRRRGASWMQTNADPQAPRDPMRESLTRFYPKRTDPTRTRGARRRSRARRQARSLKTQEAAI